jgi:hypothetical protein
MADEVGVLEDQQEDLEDLGEAGKQYQAVVNQADWTVETIIKQIDKGNIELNPAFQRREAWRNLRKSQYIESLILNVPVPQIVLAERKDKRENLSSSTGNNVYSRCVNFIPVTTCFKVLSLRVIAHP